MGDFTAEYHGGHRPEHRLGTAEQHIEHDRDRQRDREVLRLDVAEMMRIEPTADAGKVVPLE